MPQQLKVVRELDVAGAALIGLGAPPGTQLHVDTTLGNDGNDGLGWGGDRAYSTIGKAMAQSKILTARGRVQIYVAPGGYTEDIATPLNATTTPHPFGQLIAFNPTPRRSFGAAWTTASTAGVECLQIKARGWYIDGFEFDALADAECVLLDGVTTSASAQGTEIAHCLFVGQNQGLYGIDVTGNGAPLTQIHDCGFYGFTSGSTAGKCITCTSSGTDQPRFWMIEHCWFGDSDNLIDMNPRGFKESTIRYNTFYTNGANQNPDEIIDNTGGNDTQVYGNKFPEPYTKSGGYVAGTNDNWAGNFAETQGSESANGLTYADPA